MSEVDELVARIAESVGEAVFEDTTGFALPPEPRETWIDLQSEVLEVARRSTPAERVRLAETLLDAILDQPSYGPSNRLRSDVFSFLLDTLGDDLSRALDRGSSHQASGRRYVLEHLWVVPGEAGAMWLRRLALADDIGASSLFQSMRVEKAPRWRDEDWPGRIDAIASLPKEPRPPIVTVAPFVELPRVAAEALTRFGLAHGIDEVDSLVRQVSRQLQGLRDHEPDHDVDLFDWRAGCAAPELFRWILEISGDDGERPALVAAALRRHLVSHEEADALAAPVERPAWADVPVPWQVDRIEPVGSIALPSGRLSGGDPWWTGAAEGFPWVLELGTDRAAVDVVVARHPLLGSQCAALLATIREGDVNRWQIVEATGDPEGYTVEVGVAGFGSPEAYDASLVHEAEDEEMFAGGPRWQVIEAQPVGGIAMCTVGPQHQLCRTWAGTSKDDVVVQLVTDLGLLDLDPISGAQLPW